MPAESDLSKISIAPVASPAPVAQLPPSTPPPVSAPTAGAPLSTPTAIPAGEGGFSIRQLAQQRGYDATDFKTDAEMAEALLARAEQFDQMEPLANIGRQFAPHIDKMAEWQEFLQGKEAEAQRIAAEEAKKATAPAIDWQKPEWDPNWLQHCRQDPTTGLYEPIHPDWAPEARKLNNAIDARRFNSQRLVDEFPDLLDKFYGAKEKLLKETLLGEVRGLVQAEFLARQNQERTSAFLEKHAKEIFQYDAAGKIVMDAPGQPRLTARGQALGEHAQRLVDKGVSDPEFIQTTAEALVAADAAAGKFGPPGQPAPSGPPPGNGEPAPRSKRFLRRVLTNERTVPRGGAVPDDTAPQRPGPNPSANLSAIMDRIAQERGGLS